MILQVKSIEDIKMNKELAKTLSTALVQFIDREIPEVVMCCSNTECESIEQMLEGEHFDIVEAFIQKKLSRFTEFEEELVNFYNKRSMLPQDKDGVYNRHDCEELLHESAKKLLALAKKELARRNEVITLDKLSYDKEPQDGKAEAMADLERTFDCNPDKLPGWLKDELGRKHLEGYIKGRNDALREMSDFMESHFNTKRAKEGENLTDLYYKEYERNPEPIPTGVAYNPSQCGTNVTIAPNINSGTSTLKAEG